jgi:hypothetical protein
VSYWTHPLCYPCWEERVGTDRTPVRLNPRELETCCRCGYPTNSGIYIRASPTELPECTRDHERG